MCRDPYARLPRISGGIGAEAGDSDYATRPHDAGPGWQLATTSAQTQVPTRKTLARRPPTDNHTDPPRINIAATSGLTDGRRPQ